MHGNLVKYWIEVAALLVTPIAPHFTEHLWSTVLGKPQSIQLARWPTPSSEVDAAAVEAGSYMRGTIKTIRDAELTLIKRLSRGKSSPYDPKKPKAVRVYVASRFPEWQNECIEAVKEAYDSETQKVDDVKVREGLQRKELLKDKRAMPFIQLFKVGSVNPSPLFFFFFLVPKVNPFRQRTETNATIWSGGCVQATALILRGGRLERDLGILEEIFGFGRC